MSTGSVTKSTIGQETRVLECLVVTPIGEAQFVRNATPILFKIFILFCTGLATNFLLIESLQRFYQYYGDDLQVCNCPQI